MSLDNINPDERREELVQETEQAEEEAKQKQAAILESIKQGEEYQQSETEWVELGQARFKVETDIPGSINDVFDYYDHPEPEKRTRTRDLIHAMPDLVIAIDDPKEGLIRDDEIIVAVLMSMYQEYGTGMVEKVLEPLLEPAGENLEQRVDPSFRQKRSGTPDGFRDVRGSK